MKTTDNNCGNCTVDDKDLSDLQKISNIKITDLQSEKYPNLLIFPQNFNIYGDNIHKEKIFTLDSNNRLKTGNIMGFIGINETQLTISSRFTEEDEEDYFLHYMLQKVFSINLFELKHSSNTGKVFDFLLYLFPYYLKAAFCQGIFKEYEKKEYNNANIRGYININKHIRYNIPFNGNIVYKTREYSYNNHITQLIRHTIEFIKLHPLGKFILKDNTEIRNIALQIISVTPTYNRNERVIVISQNMRPLSHPYFSKYKELQSLCLQILRYEGLKYGDNNDLIYGLLFNGAWLWEEYMNVILKDKFNHYSCHKGKIFNLLKETKTNTLIQKIIPDFISKSKPFIIIDTKYIPLDKGNKYADYDEKALNIYYKTITYMYRWNSKLGVLLYPCNDSTLKTNTYQIIDTNGQLISIGFPIPQNILTYSDFCRAIKGTEYSLKKILNNYSLSQKSNKLTYTIEACRVEHPNAYKPWTLDDDDKLEVLWCEGKTTKELSDIFQRKPGAIRSRIKKLELEIKYIR